jgi:hypothetical protein
VSHHVDEPRIASKLETKGKSQMRAILLAMLTAGTIGLIGTSETFAAPASGSVLGAAATTESLVQLSRWRVRCWHRGYSRRVCRRIWW